MRHIFYDKHGVLLRVSFGLHDVVEDPETLAKPQTWQAKGTISLPVPGESSSKFSPMQFLSYSFLTMAD